MRSLTIYSQHLANVNPQLGLIATEKIEIDTEVNVIDFTALSEVKEQLVIALSTLPEETILLSNEQTSSLTPVNLTEIVEQDIAQKRRQGAALRRPLPTN